MRPLAARHRSHLRRLAVAGVCLAAAATLAGCAGGVDSSRAPSPATASLTTATPAAPADPARFVHDVTAVTHALRRMESILTVQSSSAEGIDAVRAHGDAIRAQLDAMDAAAARMRGYRVTVAATDLRRRAVLSTLPEVTTSGREMLVAIDHRDGRRAADAGERLITARLHLMAALSA